MKKLLTTLTVISLASLAILSNPTSALAQTCTASCRLCIIMTDNCGGDIATCDRGSPPDCCTCVAAAVPPAAPPAGIVQTGLGPIPTDPEGLANWVLYYAVRIAGGLALALLMSGGIKFITAQGDFKAMPEAKKTITAALTGLLVIFFSILILRVIGYDILGLPGWGDAGGLQLPQ